MLLHHLQLLLIPLAVAALNCTQCKPPPDHLSDAEAQPLIIECQQGLMPPTPCSDPSHTHCVVSYYRPGGETERIVTQRQCGVEADHTGCTLYNSKISRKVRRHLLSRDENSVHRKESMMSFVEVCRDACKGGECFNSSNVRGYFLIALALLFL